MHFACIFCAEKNVTITHTMFLHHLEKIWSECLVRNGREKLLFIVEKIHIIYKFTTRSVTIYRPEFRIFGLLS